MKRTIQVISLLFLFSGLASAQEATLNSPIVRASETKIVVSNLTLSR